MPASRHHYILTRSSYFRYFVHEQYAGISAFLNRPAEAAERNASMFAIGVLVPLSSGRLGKSWRHAPKLRDLTLFVIQLLSPRTLPLTRSLLNRKYAADMSNMQPLTEYWDSFKIGGTDTAAPDSPVESPLSLRFRPGERLDGHRGRAFSDALVLETFRPALSPFHPASSLPGFLDCFGPLIFPLYRAALLRKRILFMVEAPVHTPCNYGTMPGSTSIVHWLIFDQYTIFHCWLLYQTPFYRRYQRVTSPHCGLVPCSTSEFMISPNLLHSTPPDLPKIQKKILVGSPVQQTAS